MVDDNLGMSFNNRRQSFDRYVIDDIKKICGDKLYIDNCSSDLFDKTCLSLSDDCFYFYEFGNIDDFIDKIDIIILYKWNRVYPSDRFFPIDLSNWRIISSTSFAGYSHEKITRAIYKRNDLDG